MLNRAISDRWRLSAARFALWAMLVLALVPTLGRLGLAEASGVGNRIEVCSVGGTRWIAVNADDGRTAPLATWLHASDECPLCGVAAHGFIPTSRAAPLHWPDLPPAHLPQADFPHHAALRPWLTPPLRAPPPSFA